MDGYFIRLGDQTSCGGEVTGSDTNILMFGIAHAREGDTATCGVTGKSYRIEGGVGWITSNGRRVAGTLNSVSGCPCRASLYHSYTGAKYQPDVAAAASALLRPAAAPGSQAGSWSPSNAGPTAIEKQCSGAVQLINQCGTPCGSQNYVLLRNGELVGKSALSVQGFSHICESIRPTSLQIATTAPAPVLE